MPSPADPPFFLEIIAAPTKQAIKTIPKAIKPIIVNADGDDDVSESGLGFYYRLISHKQLYLWEEKEK